MEGDSGDGSVSTVSREDSLALSSEGSSSNPVDCELGFALSLGVGEGAACSKLHRPSPKILTAEDLPDAFCSSSASSSLSRVNGIAGTKRTADSAPSNGSSQVVGWPPVRAYRMNSLANPAKSPPNKDFTSKSMKNNAKSTAERMNVDCCNGSNTKPVLPLKSSYVKVNMDGVAIGRKVDLTAHDCYEKLADTLEKMFNASTASANATRLSFAEHPSLSRETMLSKLLDGSFGYILTYEDKDGDWMLVGDVPWSMFLNSVRRLRIMRTAEARGLSV